MASEINFNNRALSSSIVFHTSIYNIPHLNNLCRQLPTALRTEVKDAVNKEKGTLALTERVMEIVDWSADDRENELKNPPAIFKLMDIVPEILSYLNPKDLAKAARTNTIFQEQAAQCMIQHLQTRKSYSFQDLTHYWRALHLVDTVEVLELYPDETKLITHLDFSSDQSTLEGINGRVKYDTLLKITKLVPNLKSIDFSGYGYLNAEVFTEVVQDLPELTSINLSDCKELMNPGINAMTESCPKLTSINLSGCVHLKNPTLQRLARYRDLTHLDVSGCFHISDATFIPLFQNCTRLVSLHLSLCSKITDDAFAELVQRCTTLESIDLSNIPNLHEDSFIKLIQSGSFTSIKLGSNDWVTDKAIRAIAQHCKKLTHISLWWCKNVTEASLKELSQSCPNLKCIECDFPHVKPGMPKVQEYYVYHV